MFEPIRLSSSSVIVKKTSVGFLATTCAHGVVLFFVVFARAWIHHPKEIIKDSPIKFVSSSGIKQTVKTTAVAPTTQTIARTASAAKKQVHGMRFNKSETQLNKTPEKEAVQKLSDDTPAINDGAGSSSSVQGNDGASSTGESSVPGSGIGGSAEYRSVSRAPLLIHGEREPLLSAGILELLRGSKGVVLLKVRIGVRGEVEQVDIVRSTLPLLNEILVKHIRSNWQFESSLSGGQPVRVEYLQPFSFVF